MVAEFERPGDKARRERMERLWPSKKAKPKTARKLPKPLEEPVEPVPDEVEVLDEQQTLGAD